MLEDVLGCGEQAVFCVLEADVLHVVYNFSIVDMAGSYHWRVRRTVVV